ncbi:MAG: pyrroline-5-carboxylate reductase dimerization domain-containing protein [Alphaproteobacteria bacterium]|jgi:pyrroline-5-carboxylate reductase|nr:NAD(P)-binding domain-containing protein [Rhodospirillaceae bacterium]MBT6510912.1 NAD(P)-binding domain-containing protein [Rhodospirillaceae bacterium]MBT7645833.1 NAD(P)-binding domain-containing protein [Rhodospirillaceae bacterium]MDG2482999.1 pyrroline-5-carboxylate reductase dimerization domain-containing protein [Alphaproteobacteria bacterium]
MKLGIIGGTGWLGGAIARRLLSQRFVAPDDLHLSNRSGKRDGFETWPDVTITADNQTLVDACDCVVLAVRPEQLRETVIDASGVLVLSVMASTPMARISELTGAHRIIRTMPSPAVERGEGFTPWHANAAAMSGDRTTVQALFDACGIAEEVAGEGQIDWFTSLTGPVPGLFGYVAHALIEASVAHGLSREVAERAIRFHAMAAGNEILKSDLTPAQDIERVLGYGGVTTAGFEAANDAGGMEVFDVALKAALAVAIKDWT